MPSLAALPSLFNTRIVVGAVIVAYCLLWLLAKRFLMRGGWKILPMVIGLAALLFNGNELRWEVFEGTAGGRRTARYGERAGVARV